MLWRLSVITVIPRRAATPETVSDVIPEHRRRTRTTSGGGKHKCRRGARTTSGGQATNTGVGPGHQWGGGLKTVKIHFWSGGWLSAPQEGERCTSKEHAEHEQAQDTSSGFSSRLIQRRSRSTKQKSFQKGELCQAGRLTHERCTCDFHGTLNQNYPHSY